jgi:hypothetical protein
MGKQGEEAEEEQVKRARRERRKSRKQNSRLLDISIWFLSSFGSAIICVFSL